MGSGEGQIEVLKKVAYLGMWEGQYIFEREKVQKYVNCVNVRDY